MEISPLVFALIVGFLITLGILGFLLEYYQMWKQEKIEEAEAMREEGVY